MRYALFGAVMPFIQRVGRVQMGTVVDTRGTGEQSQAQIDFGSSGVKWLVLRYAALEKL